MSFELRKHKIISLGVSNGLLAAKCFQTGSRTGGPQWYPVIFRIKFLHLSFREYDRLNEAPGM